MSFDVGEVTGRAHSPNFPSLHLHHNSFFNPSVALPTSQLILQPFRCFTYITVHSPTLLSLYLRHSSFPTLPSLYLRHSSLSNPSVASPTSQLILQPFRLFTYVTAHSPTLAPFTYVTANSITLPLLHPRHRSFCNPSFASPTSQALHLRHLVSRPCFEVVGLYIGWGKSHGNYFFFRRYQSGGKM